MIDKSIIEEAYNRIKPYINYTPIVSSDLLNQMLGHQIMFKAESLQITGSFKVRGVLNTLLTLKENNNLPKKLVAYSSGNHARAVAWGGPKIASIETELYMHKSASSSKQKAVRELGANLIITETRITAEQTAKEIGNQPGNYFIHPSDNDLVIAGAATLSYEAINQLDNVPDAIFAACGGGALLSGTYLGIKAHDNKTKNCKIYAAEPTIANDAARSYKLGKIVGFEESPLTVADGVRTLKVSERTFKYLQKLDGFVEAAEKDITYWTCWLNKLLPIPCEPTAALAMAAAFNWLKTQTKLQKVLIIISGGNIDEEVLTLLDSNEFLDNPPKLS